MNVESGMARLKKASQKSTYSWLKNSHRSNPCLRATWIRSTSSRSFCNHVTMAESLEKGSQSLESERKKKGIKLRLAYVFHYAPLRYIHYMDYIYIFISISVSILNERINCILYSTYLCSTPNRCKPPLIALVTFLYFSLFFCKFYV